METKSIKVQLNWFGQLGELAESPTESLEIPIDTNVKELIAKISTDNPKLKTIAISVAVNSEMADGDEKLSDADHVDLFPPYSGG